MGRAVVVGISLLVAVAGCLDLGGGDEEPDGEPRGPSSGGSSGGSSNSGSSPSSSPPPRPPPPAVPETLDIGASGCTRLEVTTTADVALIRPWLPEQYVLVGEATGRALMVATVVTCETITPPGREPAPGAFSDLGFVIEAPDGSSGDHVYRLWQATDNIGLAASLQRFGLIEAYVPGITLETASPVPLAAAAMAGTVPWAGLAYWVNATVGVPATPDVARDETWWFHSAKGPVKISAGYGAGTASSVVGDVSAKDGTLLAQFMGAPTQPGPGTLETRDLTWFVERVELPG